MDNKILFLIPVAEQAVLHICFFSHRRLSLHRVESEEDLSYAASPVVYCGHAIDQQVSLESDARGNHVWLNSPGATQSLGYARGATDPSGGCADKMRSIRAPQRGSLPEWAPPPSVFTFNYQSPLTRTAVPTSPRWRQSLSPGGANGGAGLIHWGDANSFFLFWNGNGSRGGGGLGGLWICGGVQILQIPGNRPLPRFSANAVIM